MNLDHDPPARVIVAVLRLFDNSYKCPYCQKTGGTADEVKNHIFLHHFRFRVYDARREDVGAGPVDAEDLADDWEIVPERPVANQPIAAFAGIEAVKEEGETYPWEPTVEEQLEMKHTVSVWDRIG